MTNVFVVETILMHWSLNGRCKAWGVADAPSAMEFRDLLHYSRLAYNYNA